MHENKIQRNIGTGPTFWAMSENVPIYTFLDTKCLKLYNKNVSTLSNIFLFL